MDVFSDLCRVQFLVFLPLYLVDVLSELLLGPVPGFTPVIIGGCVVWTFIGSSSWSNFRYIWWMCCLNFCRVQFLVLLPLYFVDVLSELLWGPVPGLTPVIFGGCVFWTFIGSNSCLTPFIFGGCVVLTYVVSSSWFYSCYIWCMCCLHFCIVQFLV